MRSDSLSDDRRYWFPAKRYGWGWGLPVTWQGWVVVAAWCAALFAGLFALRHDRKNITLHVLFVLLMSLVLTLICYWKGEPPRWRWGDKRK